MFKEERLSIIPSLLAHTTLPYWLIIYVKCNQMPNDEWHWNPFKAIKNNVINHRTFLPSSGIMMINSPRWRPSTTMKSSMIKTKVWSGNIDNNWRSGCHSDSHTTIHHHILRKCCFFCMLTKEQYHKQYHSPWLMDFMKISSFYIPPNQEWISNT